jgi:Holliday junction resolvase YEN1
VGLVGCGKAVAHGLARTSLGDQLLEAAKNLSEGELETFLVLWLRQPQEELIFNKQGFLKCRYPTITNAVHSDFPQTSDILKYTQPVTSWAGGRPLPSFSTWVHHEPDLAELASLAERSFSWSPDKIMEKFRKHVWPGLCLRRLLEVSVDLPRFSIMFTQSFFLR